MKKIQIVALSEIILMIGMIFAFSYLLAEASKTEYIQENENGKYGLLLSILKIITKILFSDKNFVSALSSSIYTCPLDKNGVICQEYTSDECNSKCAVECLPTTRDKSSICKTGTCYDPYEGTCQAGATNVECAKNGGQWFNDIFGNFAECKPGCCVIGDQAYFGTKRQCERDALTRGIAKDFKPEINSEISCLALAKTQEEGACVFENNLAEKNNCKFTTKLNCQQVLKGKFYSGLLCSNSVLNTVCEKEKSVGCVNNKWELYWLDSCGNQENIYDINKVKSWNNGEILSKSDSCSLIEGNNLLANQKTCGNCNYLIGSICGKETSSEKLSENGANFNFVCKDVSCTDKNGVKRQNGESWCQYQGSIGVVDNKGSDSVGSRQFRFKCFDGQITNEPCDDYRNEICVEQQTSIPNGKFSTSACRVNRAYECFDYNQEGKKDKCETNPDCFIKHVAVNNQFQFDVCVPKVKPGFDLEARGDGAAKLCGLATQKCKYVKSCSALSGCKEFNKECLQPKFAEELNNFCMSLGDCGAQVNYAGTLTENYKITRNGEVNYGQQITGSYISALKLFSKTIKGKFLEPGDLSAFYGELGVPGTLGQPDMSQDKVSSVIKQAQTITGVAGILLLVGGKLAPTAAGGLFASFGSGQVASNAGGATYFSNANSVVGTSVNPSLVAIGKVAGTALALAGIAFTIYGFAQKGDWGAVALLSVVAVVATVAIASSGFSTALTLAAVFAAIPFVGIIIAVIALVLSFLGKKTEIDVQFQCLPWQAPSGGKECNKCGSDGLPCSQYSCKSLGQTCDLINEGTENAECINIVQNDSTPPVISPNENLLPDGYTLEKKEYGVKIKKGNGNGCITGDDQDIPFGILLNEHGQCVASGNHTNSDLFNAQQVLSSGLYLNNHSLPISVPSVLSIALELYNPNATADLNYYVRCKDKSGNINENEFVINFCVKPGNDSTPAVVLSRTPALETTQFNATEINASVLTSEPADCKWSDKDKDYTQMENNFSCLNGFYDKTIMNDKIGWSCNSMLPFPISKNNSIFYVRCLDQPWQVEENYSKRNSNTQSYQFKLARSKGKLKIDSINVDNKTLTYSSEPASVDIIVKTSGGLDGVARCGYKIGNSSEFIDFLSTFDTEHEQTFTTLFSGSYTLPIHCIDPVNNVADKSAKFKIKIDSEPPKLTRVYASGGTMNVITDEDSTCYYNLDRSTKCNFDFENATLLYGEGAKIHSMQFDVKNTYYIKCKDGFGHYSSSCTAIIRGGKYDTQEL